MDQRDRTQQEQTEQGEVTRERPQRRTQAASESAPQQERYTVTGESIAQTKRVIDLIEQRMNEAYRVPLKKDLCVVEASVLIDLIGQLRIALPKAVVQAQSVLASREKILEDARIQADKTADNADAIYKKTVGEANRIRDEIHAETDAYEKETRRRVEEDANAMIADANTRAEQILFAAQQQAQQMLEENEITRRAQAYALELSDRAQKDAQSIYEQAVVQADKLLSGATAALSRSANDLAAARDNLIGSGTGREY